MHYRADIDGLRALAVLSVLFFHLGFSDFGGGYVGVDVFFVISGYLITRLIRDEVVTTGSFSFSNFYLRRVRRLAPALLFTFALCFACAMVLFSPADLQRFAGALVHAVFSVSNFYFWMESGYFDAEITVKPLLHTWSLSVEEQFYLIWPVTLVFLLLKTPRYTIPVVLGLAGVVSLAINIDFYDGYSPIVQAIAPSLSDWFAEGPATIYFLAPFRVFEFAIGAGLVFLAERKSVNAVLAEALTALGLVMILVAVLMYTEATPFPTFYALVPCVGAALIIYFAGASRLCKLFLSNPVMVRLGLISYSLYLIHWPMIVFYGYYTKAELSLGERWTIVLVSIVAAELMYRWVETPVRNYSRSPKKAAPRRLVYATALSAAVICVPAVGAWSNQGWTWRFGDGGSVQSFGDIKELQQERADYIHEYLAEQGEGVPGKRNILVVGDSLGHDMVLSLAQNLDDTHSVQFQRYNALCYPIFVDDLESDSENCTKIYSAFEKSEKISGADEIYVAYAMAPNFWATEFVPLIEYLKEKARPDTRIVLFGRRPAFPDFHSTAVSMLSDGSSVEQIEQRAREISGDQSPLDRQMRAAAEGLGIDFISTYAMACTSDRCRFFGEDGSLMFWDKHHWTVQGATWFGSEIVASLSRNAMPVVEASEPAEEPVETSVVEGPAIEDQSVQNVPLEEAVIIVRRYMSELNRIGIDARTLYDITLLPESKSIITASLLRLMEATPDEGARASYRTGIILLAHFQPDIGEATVGIDQLTPAQTPWQDVVDREKQELNKTIIKHRRTKEPQLLGSAF